jgi:hypothetical protein
MHVPPEHTPDAHGVSQPFTVLPSQSAQPLLHAGVHTPPEHAVVPRALVQAMPHPPQWLVLVSMFVSHMTGPLVQLAVPAGQLSTWQLHVPLPPWHEYPAPALHALPHEPQFMLVLSAVSHPLVALPSQLPYPALHVALHTPAPVHRVVPWSFVHSVPHNPQLTVAVRLVSQPLAALSSQLPHPLSHAGLHTPAGRHVLVLCSCSQSPQGPQLCGDIPHVLLPQSAGSVSVPSQMPPHPLGHVCPRQYCAAQAQSAVQPPVHHPVVLHVCGGVHPPQ